MLYAIPVRYIVKFSTKKSDPVMIKTSKPLLGWAFNDVLNELHQHVFEGVPGESEPFELSLLRTRHDDK